jgi:peroxiredoxin Q/BCP
MAQLRQDYEGFVDRETEVIAVGPDTRRAFKDYWRENNLPFIGLADPDHAVAKQYSQEVNILKFGRIPAQLLIDKSGVVRFLHYSNSMSDIPDNQEIFEKLDEINIS